MRRSFASTALLSAVLALSPLPCAAQALVPFGPEFRVNTYTTGGQSGPAVALNAAGEFVVVWQGAGESDASGVFGQRFDAAGTALGSEFRVNSYTTGSQDFPAIARDDLGDFIVVWRSLNQDGNFDGIYGRLYNAAGAPQASEFRVNTYTTNAQLNPRVANDSTGAFVVTWDSVGQDSAASGGDVWARRYSAKGIALGGEFRVNSYTTGTQYASAVAVGADGFVVAFGGHGAADDEGIAAQRFDPTGTPLGDNFGVNAFTTGTQKGVNAAVDSHGNLLLSWSDFSQGGVRAQRFSSTGAPAGSEFQVNALTTGSQFGDAVAADAAGTFVIVWQSAPTPGAYDIFARTVRPGGTLAGSDVVVNTFTTGSQILAKAAGGPAGAFVVVWKSPNQATPTSSDDVYARLLRPSGDVNGDGVVNVSDVFYLINNLFAGGPPPLGPANPNGVGGSDVGDVFYLINFLFAGGPDPV